MLAPSFPRAARLVIVALVVLAAALAADLAVALVHVGLAGGELEARLDGGGRLGRGILGELPDDDGGHDAARHEGTGRPVDLVAQLGAQAAGSLQHQHVGRIQRLEARQSRRGGPGDLGRVDRLAGDVERGVDQDRHPRAVAKRLEQQPQIGMRRALDRLQGFASHFGADFYGLPRHVGEITLVREPWNVPLSVPFATS